MNRLRPLALALAAILPCAAAAETQITVYSSAQPGTLSPANFRDAASPRTDDSGYQNDRKGHGKANRQCRLLVGENAKARKLVEMKHPECPCSSVTEVEGTSGKQRIGRTIAGEAFEVVSRSYCGNRRDDRQHEDVGSDARCERGDDRFQISRFLLPRPGEVQEQAQKDRRANERQEFGIHGDEAGHYKCPKNQFAPASRSYAVDRKKNGKWRDHKGVEISQRRICHQCERRR